MLLICLEAPLNLSVSARAEVSFNNKTITPVLIQSTCLAFQLNRFYFISYLTEIIYVLLFYFARKLFLTFETTKQKHMCGFRVAAFEMILKGLKVATCFTHVSN